MAWVSGRTIAPTSGELVFVIDAEAPLPRAQTWIQVWQVCRGIPRLRSEPDSVLTISHNDGLQKIAASVSHHEQYVGDHLETNISAGPTVDESDMLGFFDDSECDALRRNVTFSFVNFDINDGGDSVATTESCRRSQLRNPVDIFARARYEPYTPRGQP